MRVKLVLIGDDPLESLLDLGWIAARREPGAVRHPEDMGIDGDGRLTEGDVEDDIGRLSPHARKFLQRRPVVRHLAAMLRDELPRQGGEVARLAAIETDRLDVCGDLLLAECCHPFRRVRSRESAGVALLTPASVACADSTTATRSVNGLS